MLLFRTALRDPSHPARRLVENELLDGLQFLWSANERPNAPLRYDRVRISDLIQMAEGLASERGEWWARALTELQPSRQKGRQPAFESITIVSAGGRPLLATSPFTAIFTAEDAASAPRDITGSYFRYIAGDDARELADRPLAFQRYVAQVLFPQLENADSLAHADSDAQSLQSEMKGWLKEQIKRCRDAAGAEHRDRLASPEGGDWRGAAVNLGLEELTDLSGGLRLFARKGGVDMQESSWILRSTRQRQGAPLILQPSMFDGRYTPGLAPVSLPANGLDSLDRETLPQVGTRYPWVYPEKHWFADQILILAEPLQANNVIGFANFRSLYVGEKTYLRQPQFTLPLKREVLSFFTPEELEQRLTIDVQPSGHVEVALRVPVGPNSRDLVVKRRYDDTAFFHEVTGPALTLWPRFKSAGWKDYTLFRRDENSNVAQFIAVHAVSEGQILPEDAEQRNEVARVSSFGVAPEAIEFASLITGGSSAQRLGLVLPRFRDPQPIGPAQWRVGIDFGTSNTVATIKTNPESAPVVLQASDMTLPLTEATPQTLSLMDAYFMPHLLAPRPFGTAAVVFEQLRTLNIQNERIGVRVNVPFNGNVQSDSRNRVSGDLKWSTEPNTRFLTASFLRHVLAVILAQATERGVDPRHVEFVWSYPRAFTPTQTNQLETVWEQVRLYFSDRLGGIGSISRGLDESRAVLQFFANDQQVTTAGDVNVILDIGGGTSDIAMYGHGRTIVLDSVMLGGRNLTGQRDWAGTAQSQRNAFVNRFVAWADRNLLGDYPVERDAVLKYLSDGQDHLAFTYLLQSRWFESHGKAFSGEEAAHRFQALVFYLFAALAYYVGLSLREEQRAQPDQDYAPVTMMLAGNGSQYLHWLTDLRPDAQGDFARVLGRLVLSGLKAGMNTPPPRVALTSQPKREVALGLVARADIKGVKDGENARGSVAGETFEATLGDQRSHKALSAEQRLKSSDILFADQVAGLKWNDGEMEIERFHSVFIREAESIVGYGQQWSGNIQRLRQTLVSLNRRELQQLTRSRLELVANAVGGFQGSLFIAEVTAVTSVLQDRFFAGSDLPTATGGVKGASR